MSHEAIPARPIIRSPCVRVCAVDGTRGLCIGCGRTLKEIGGWSRLTDEERDRIMDVAAARLRQPS